MDSQTSLLAHADQQFRVFEHRNAVASPPPQAQKQISSEISYTSGWFSLRVIKVVRHFVHTLRDVSRPASLRPV